MSWYEAFAFCIWDGGRLQTEAEFEYAAAGGAQNRLYPWGSAPLTNLLAVYGGCGDGNCAVASAEDVRPVAGEGRWHHQDLAGNAWEWTFDWRLDRWYDLPSSRGKNPIQVTEPPNNPPSDSRQRTIREGNSSGVGTAVRGVHRYYGGTPDAHYLSTGVRCARRPK